ncbi:6-phospho-beta-glucosidase [Arthrobacter sp. LAR12-1-1.1]|uniref:family 4 glycosyl hydrolase n=1 Tax=Arthrobacter sp. LAR12-1-1.1 TaxID=3135215 RepID=UPI003431A5B8
MRLTIAGGGGFRVPLVYRALSTGPFAGLVRELVLYDVDPARLAAIEAVLASLAQQGPPGSGPQVRAVSSLPEALDGADMVFAAIRPGGTAGRTADERIALDLGLLGQETTGPGGISYALRSIPPMLRLAEEMRSRCPAAWLLNFTNPAGMVTEALAPVLGPKVIGICDSASGLVHRAARAAGVALPEGTLDGVGYYGLNHLGWLYRLEDGGRDALPELLADPAALSGFEEGRLFPPGLLAELGCLPNEYLFYYYDTARAVAGMRAAEQTRGESIARQQAELYPRLAAAGPDAFALWDAARLSREEGYLAEARASGERRDETDLAGGGYERVALAAMRALSGGGAADLILNTRNTVNAAGSAAPEAGAAGSAAQAVPAVPGLPADAVVEVPCTVTPDGAVPVPQDRPAPAQLELMRRVKEVERLVVEAATAGRREAALAAFARHPLVDSEVLAGKLLAGYEAAFPELGRLWHGGQ